MRLVFYCSSTNRKTYGVNLDAPHHIHPGVISTKATEAVATFRQPKGPGAMISPRQFAPDITRQARGASHYHQSAAKQQPRVLYTALIRPHHPYSAQATNHSAKACGIKHKTKQNKTSAATSLLKIISFFFIADFFYI